jgi:oligopeptidase B
MENSFTKKKQFVFKSSVDLFYSEIRDRIVESEDSIPESIGQYYYYSRMIAKSEFQIYIRRKIFPPDSPEEVILDGNLVALEHDYLFISTIKMSHDHKLMAYIVDTTGTETFRVIIKNLETGDELTEEIIEDVVNAEWLKDGKTLLYTVADDKKRPSRVFLHRLGTPTSLDKMIYEEKDDRFFLDIVRSKDWKYLFINANSKTSAEIILVDSVEPTNPLRKIISRDTPAEYYLEHAHVRPKPN